MSYIEDRFNDEYDPEPDLDRPTRAEAEAEEREGYDFVRDDAWVAETYRQTEPADDESTDDYEDRFCPVCGADIVGNEPHAPDCPVEVPEEAQDAPDA